MDERSLGQYRRGSKDGNRLRPLHSLCADRKQANISQAPASRRKGQQISSIPAHLAGPIAEEMSKDQYDTNPEEFLQTLKTKWLTKMQADETSAADQQTIARLLKTGIKCIAKANGKTKPKNTP